ncbi:cysteine desulfurase family protein [Bacteroidota bacterium]
MERIVYLDNNATTAIHPEVKKAITEAMELYGNPSSMHKPGQMAHFAIEDARENIARFINAKSEDILFTGSGSEANNTVFNSIYYNCQACNIHKDCKKGPAKDHIITSVIEHPSVLQTLKCYEKRGVEVSYLPVDKYGLVKPEDVKKAIKQNTGLISIMYANNEIGTIQPIKEISDIASQHNISFHTDAVQAAGKIDIDVKELNANYMTLSGHKIYGPKGTGILYVKKGTEFCPLIYGGHHEYNRRAGTENTIGIVALGKAFEQLSKEMKSDVHKMAKLKEMLLKGFLERIPDISINGHIEKSLPNTLNVTFDYVEGESILLFADIDGISVSTGSACSTGDLSPSHVVMALGVNPENAHGSVRFSLGRENTEEDIKYVLEKFPPIIQKLRKMSPLYKTNKK